MLKSTDSLLATDSVTQTSQSLLALKKWLHGGLKAGEVGEDFILGFGTCARVNEVIRLCCGCRRASHACRASAGASETDSRRAASET